MSIWILEFVAFCLIFSGALMIWRFRPAQELALEQRRRFSSALGTIAEGSGPGWVRQLASFGLRSPFLNSKQKNEIDQLLALAEWDDPRNRGIFYVLGWGLPLVLIAGSVMLMLIGVEQWGYGLIAAAAGYLLPRYVLRRRATQRREKIVEEIPTIARLMALLLVSGISIEQALRVLVDDAGPVLPGISMPLRRIIVRIDVGQSRHEAMEIVDNMLGVPELRDFIKLLDQSAKYGGSVNASLQRLASLAEDRIRTLREEQASKLTVKMTVVMVLFMLPPLLIFAAGPGMLSLVRALGQI